MGAHGRPRDCPCRAGTSKEKDSQHTRARAEASALLPARMHSTPLSAPSNLAERISSKADVNAALEQRGKSWEVIEACRPGNAEFFRASITILPPRESMGDSAQFSANVDRSWARSCPKVWCDAQRGSPFNEVVERGSPFNEVVGCDPRIQGST